MMNFVVLLTFSLLLLLHTSRGRWLSNLELETVLRLKSETVGPPLGFDSRVFLYKGVLTNEECDHLIQLAKHNKVKKSMVADNLVKVQDEIVGDIETRLAVGSIEDGSLGRCVDKSTDCAQNANLCRNSSYYNLMKKNCAKTCHFC